MKGNQEPMLYTTNAAVASLNHVPGFDPLKFLRRTASRKTGEDVMRLDLRYKKLWFRLACPTGRLIHGDHNSDPTEEVKKFVDLWSRKVLPMALQAA